MDALDSVLKVEERLVLKATAAKIPIGGAIELTPLCNMNCDMCFIRLNQEEMRQVGRMKTVDEWLLLADEMKNAGTLFVLLTGGEPFLYPDFIRLYEGLIQLGMIITLNTNGTLVTKEIAHTLERNKPRRVNITLYGASNETYEKLCHNPKGFDQTIRGIELLLKHNIAVKLNGSIVPENQHEIKKLQDIADKYGLYIKMDTYMYPASRERLHLFNPKSRLSPETASEKTIEVRKMQMTDKEFENYRQHILENCHLEHFDGKDGLSCRAGSSSYWLTWYGHMTPCIFMKTPGIDVFKEGFEHSWEYISKEVNKLHLPKACMTCEKKSVCMVCGASAYHETGNCDKKPQYLCDYTYHMIELLKEEQ